MLLTSHGKPAESNCASVGRSRVQLCRDEVLSRESDAVVLASSADRSLLQNYLMTGPFKTWVKTTYAGKQADNFHSNVDRQVKR